MLNMIKNHVKFDIDDVVCLKSIITSPIGNICYSAFQLVPMKIIDIYKDRYFKDRIGEIGDDNEYVCVELFSGFRVRKYQKELEFWSERKDEIISKIKTYLIALENS